MFFFKNSGILMQKHLTAASLVLSCAMLSFSFLFALPALQPKQTLLIPCNIWIKATPEDHPKVVTQSTRPGDSVFKKYASAPDQLCTGLSSKLTPLC